MTEQEFADYQVDPEVHAVVKGVCEAFNFRKIAIASLYLSDPKMVFCATNEDYTWICGKSMRHMPDVGATLRAIEVSSGRKAFIVGKPMPYMFQALLEEHFAD
jgi:phosphoglycolate phosphatase